MEPSILSVVEQICKEKDISFEAVIATIEQALAAAYRKDFGKKNQNIKVEFDPKTGQTRIFDIKTVVEDLEETSLDSLSGLDADLDADKRGSEKMNQESANGVQPVAKRRAAKKSEEKIEEKKSEDNPPTPFAKGELEEERKFNPRTEITLTEAKEIQKTRDKKVQIFRENEGLKKSHGFQAALVAEQPRDPSGSALRMTVKGKIKIGDIIKTELEVPAAYGRMAAQSAKQVIVQKLREAEKEALYNKFKEKEGKVLIGIVQKKEGPRILIDLEKITAIIPPSEQIREELCQTGQRIRVYLLAVNQTTKGPEVILSRTHPEIVRQLFFSEVPEVGSGSVEIKALAREAGSRTKIAVQATQKNIDPIGSCVGQRGSRVQTIISELGGEKIDIIEYNEDLAKFIASALSPAKVLSVDLDEEKKIAKVKVKGDQYSLAIGKGGQNVRLACLLTGFRLDIVQVEEKTAEEEKGEEKIIDGK